MSANKTKTKTLIESVLSSFSLKDVEPQEPLDLYRHNLQSATRAFRYIITILIKYPEKEKHLKLFLLST